MRKSFLIILLFFGVFLSSCILFQNENRVELERRYYIIDQSLILEEIELSSHLTLVGFEEPPLGKINENNLVFWDSEDFFEVMSSVHSFIWAENNANWKISYVSYDWSCSHLESGPQSASLTYFQTNRGDRFVSEIYLHPTQNFASGVRSKYSPIINRWKAIDFSQIRISPEAVLTIAEENGGFDFRGASGNQCVVSVSYNTSLFNGWQVLYSPNEGSPLVIKINPKSGEIK